MIAGVTGAKDPTKSGCCFAKPFTYSRHFAPMNFYRFQRNFAVVVCREGSGILIFPFHFGSKSSSRFFGASRALTNSVLKRILIGSCRHGEISASFSLHCSGTLSEEGGSCRANGPCFFIQS